MDERLPVKSHDPNVEINSQTLSERIVELVDNLCGQAQWSGGTPYEIKAMDTQTQKAYVLAIRRGEDWITIQQRESSNPSLVRHYSIVKKNDVWNYIDPYQLKYGESSLLELQGIFERLNKIWDLSKSKEMDNDRDTPKGLSK
ncbi:MAG: hypothetical protein HY433_03785 [Candidatus Liptonbacteria bacterium]|nr:hypothetical protein [Candidatus Liptonbacteria bacterium]